MVVCLLSQAASQLGHFRTSKQLQSCFIRRSETAENPRPRQTISTPNFGSHGSSMCPSGFGVYGECHNAWNRITYLRTCYDSKLNFFDV